MSMPSQLTIRYHHHPFCGRNKFGTWAKNHETCDLLPFLIFYWVGFPASLGLGLLDRVQERFVPSCRGGVYVGEGPWPHEAGLSIRQGMSHLRVTVHGSLQLSTFSSDVFPLELGAFSNIEPCFLSKTRTCGLVGFGESPKPKWLFLHLSSIVYQLGFICRFKIQMRKVINRCDSTCMIVIPPVRLWVHVKVPDIPKVRTNFVLEACHMWTMNGHGNPLKLDTAAGRERKTVNINHAGFIQITRKVRVLIEQPLFLSFGHQKLELLLAVSGT